MKFPTTEFTHLADLTAVGHISPRFLIEPNTLKGVSSYSRPLSLVVYLFDEFGYVLYQFVSRVFFEHACHGYERGNFEQAFY